MKHTCHPMEFMSDRMRLSGVLHLPDVPSPPLVVGSHGLEGTKDSAKQRILGDLLPPMGIAFFRFDHRGCGNSDGSFVSDTSLETRVQDMISAVTHVLSLALTSRRFALFGSSLGGSTVIASWKRLVDNGFEPLGAVICAAPVRSRTIHNIPVAATPDRPELPLSFFETNLLFDISDKAAHLANVLIFHGDRDEIVPVENGHMIQAAAREPKRLIVQTGGDHRMTDPSHQEEFERETSDWFNRTFGLR